MRIAALLLTAAALAGCSSQQARIEQQRDKLQSLGASTHLLSENWLDGHLSKTYTTTALDALFAQVEQQRAVVASTAAALTSPEAAALSQQSEQLSRLIAQMQRDVERGDSSAVRGRLGAIPLMPGDR